MTEFEGTLRMGNEERPGVTVQIDLTEERLRLSSGPDQLADWSLDEIRVSALIDGFHVRAEGEEVILETGDDGRFALALGLRSAHPVLRRKMSAVLREPKD